MSMDDQQKSSFASGYFIIWLGIIFGNAEVVLNVIYFLNTTFITTTFMKACLVFIVLQPIWYFFIYILYVGQSGEIVTAGERCKKIAMAPLYLLLQQLKLLSGIERVHKKFSQCCGYDEKLNLMTMEGNFKVQTIIELFFYTIPQMVC